MNLSIVIAAMGADLARHGVEIAGEQRDDLIAKPFGEHPGKAGNIRKQTVMARIEPPGRG